MDKIIVYIRGGVVKSVDIPVGAPDVEIRDYDDGEYCVDNTAYVEGHDWFRDEQNDPYQRSLWSNEGVAG